MTGNIWASLPGAGYGQFEHKADSLIAKFKKRAERSERLMYGQSHRDYLRSGYLHHRHCLSWAVNHYRDNAITYKADRDKNARTEAGERWQLLTCRCHVSVMLLRSDAKYTERVMADAKAENDALRDDVAAGRIGCTSKQSVDQCVKPPPPPAWIMRSLPRLAEHR